MLKKLLLLTPIIIVSTSMTACSGLKSSKAATVHKSVSKKIIASKSDIEITPVVYEKRRPAAKKRTGKRAIKSTKRYPQIARSSFSNKLSNAALGRLKSRVRYDGSYVKIAYPWGDVPSNIGVCTDVVIRSYRKLGIDLQQQVHQDMRRAFNSYPNPKKWGLSRPDTNIDHRRVYNLRKFFTRKGAALPISRNPNNYRPGDVVSWMVGPDLPHIGVVVNRRSKADPRRFMVVHNIANGPQLEDMLFRFPITGHYRYTKAHVRNNVPQTLYTSRRTSPRTVSSNDTNLLREASSLLSRSPVPVKRNKTKKQSEEVITLATLSNDTIKELLSR